MVAGYGTKICVGRFCPRQGFLADACTSERALRSVKVDFDVVSRIACEKMAAQRCVKIVKLAEGSYNKVYQLTLDTGHEVVARFPCQLVGNMQMATASEVATMEYCREVLHEPIPKVLAWSSRPEIRESVGSDFILMERSNGLSLSEHWFKLDATQAKSVLVRILYNQLASTTPKFFQIGSIYFKEDVTQHLRDRPLYADNPQNLGGEEKYCIGPIIDRQFWFNGELSVTDLCGPWSDMSSFLQDICKLGIRRAEFQAGRAGVPQSSSSLSRCKPADFPMIIRLLQDCLALAKHLPDVVQNVDTTVPILTHPDLSTSNILISPTKDRIAAFMDWQGTSVLPMIQANTIPPAILYDGDLIPIQGLPLEEDPFIPGNLEPHLAERAQTELRLANRQHRGMRMIGQLSPTIQASWADRLSWPLQMFSQTVLRSWADGPLPLRDLVHTIVSAWPDGTKCPIRITPDEMARHEVEFADYERYRTNVANALSNLGCQGDGWVSDDKYVEAKGLYDELKVNWDDGVAGGPFPFEDGKWSFHLT